jgi:hypothetical protein
MSRINSETSVNENLTFGDLLNLNINQFSADVLEIVDQTRKEHLLVS